MQNINNLHNKPHIEYPCFWRFKVIGPDAQALEAAIDEVINNHIFKTDFSNVSSGGKYKSLNLDVRVESEEDRMKIFDDLKNHIAIKMVL